MNGLQVPGSLRLGVGFRGLHVKKDQDTPYIFTAAWVIAASSVAPAEAQEAPSSLSPVTVDAPVVRHRPVATKPTPTQLKARAALRKRSQQAQPVRTAPVPGAEGGIPTFARLPGSDPYADPAAPYKADRLSSNKFTEAIINTPRSVTVLTKEVLEDKNANTLKEVARSTAGVTLGTGEGGNAFGDRFFIRGFDARNDIFVNGIRDPGVSIRENFFTEQIEILRGPASSFAGRGTSGGAINIVTKQAAEQDFYNIEGTAGFSDQNKRITLDINKAINPILSFRLDGLYQNSNVAERNFVVDDRNGVAGAILFKPTADFKITADYNHTYLNGLPDFGVPYYGSSTTTVTGSNPAVSVAVPVPGATNRPVTEGLVPRDTYYGFINRDFTKSTQNIGTLGAEYKVNDVLTLSTKFREEYSILNYIGTIPESTAFVNGVLSTTLNPQSRFQTTSVLANQTEATFKFDTGPVKNTAVAGVEFSRERVHMDTYSGLSSEVFGTGSNASGSYTTSIFNPPNTISGFGNPYLSGNYTVIPVNTQAGYFIETANYNDFIYLNGGVRYDNYDITSTKNNVGKISSLSEQTGLVNYNVGLLVKPLPYASVYGAFATSAEPVGAELDGTSASYGGLNPAATPNQIFSPQRSQALEFGTKWEFFEKHLLVTGALFQTNVENARETATINGVPNTVIAGASYRVQGIDLEVAGKVTDKWSIMGGLVLMNPRVTNSIIPSNIGLPLANVANQSFNLLTKYQVLDWLELGGQTTYRSKMLGGSLLAANGGSASNQATVLPSYWSFDAFVEAKIGANLEAKLYVSNIFNRTFYDAFYQSSRPFVLIAPGRAVSMIVTMKF